MTVLSDVDCVIHLAAETGTGWSMYEIEKYINTNILGTALLLDMITNQKIIVKKVLVAESRAIYGEGLYQSYEFNKKNYPEARADEFMQKGDFAIKYMGCEKSFKLFSTK